MKKIFLIILTLLMFSGCSKDIVYVKTKIVVPQRLLTQEKIPKVPNERNEKEVSYFVWIMYKNLKKQNKKNELIKEILNKYNKEVK